MLRKEPKQAKTKCGLQKLTVCIYNVLHYEYMDLFPRFSHI